MNRFAKPPRLAEPAYLARPHNERPWWRRPSTWIIAVLVVAWLIAVLPLTGCSGSKPSAHRPPAPHSAATPAPSGSGPSAPGSVGVPNAEQTTGTQLDAMRRAMAEYPEYFKCHQWPATATTAQIKPDINVAAVITFDTKHGTYIMTHDPRLSVKQDRTQATGESGQQLMEQVFTFNFPVDNSVRYYGAYALSPGEQAPWGAVDAFSPARTSAPYQLTLDVESGTAHPVYVVAATDVTTCAPGQVAVPANFDWADIADRGLTPPEYYRNRKGHPQG